jgi:AcrR family transcriptional regulator
MEFFHNNFDSLCIMLNHRGETLKNIIYRYIQSSGISLSALAKKAGYDQSTPYRHFEKDDLPDHILIRWGKAMSYDMTKDFPHLSQALDMVSEPAIQYPSKNGSEENQVEYWRSLYIRLLERHNALLEDRLCQRQD